MEKQTNAYKCDVAHQCRYVGETDNCNGRYSMCDERNALKRLIRSAQLQSKAYTIRHSISDLVVGAEEDTHLSGVLKVN